jgi:hypothetical protein
MPHAQKEPVEEQLSRKNNSGKYFSRSEEGDTDCDENLTSDCGDLQAKIPLKRWAVFLAKVWFRNYRSGKLC